MFKLKGRCLVQSDLGPYAGGAEREFSFKEVAAWGKLDRYGDAIRWTVAKLVDGTEVCVVAKQQSTPAQACLNKILRKLVLPAVYPTRNNPAVLRYDSTATPSNQ